MTAVQKRAYREVAEALDSIRAAQATYDCCEIRVHDLERIRWEEAITGMKAMAVMWGVTVECPELYDRSVVLGLVHQSKVTFAATVGCTMSDWLNQFNAVGSLDMSVQPTSQWFLIKVTRVISMMERLIENLDALQD